MILSERGYFGDFGDFGDFFVEVTFFVRFALPYKQKKLTGSAAPRYAAACNTNRCLFDVIHQSNELHGLLLCMVCLVFLLGLLVIILLMMR